MEITLKSIGKAKLKPNWVKTDIYIKIKSMDIDECSRTLINAIGNTTDMLKSEVDEVIFSSYNIREVSKRIEENKTVDVISTKETKYVFDGYEGYAYLSVEFSLDMSKMERIDKICKDLSVSLTNENIRTSINPDHAYTLSEESFSELDIMVVNSALDKMIIQAHKIAEHMNYSKVELKEVSFIKENTRNDFLESAVCKSAVGSNIKEYTLSDLDAMLELRDIERSTEVYSNWEME